MTFQVYSKCDVFLASLNIEDAAYSFVKKTFQESQDFERKKITND
jgi:hypothetical protein